MEQTKDEQDQCHHASTKQCNNSHDEQGGEEDHHQEQEESNKNDENGIVVPLLVVAAPLGLKKLKIPEYKEMKEEREGLKTPTSPQHRIPAMVECPPAPRKPKITTSSSKRKRYILESQLALDFSQDIQSLFPTTPPKPQPHISRRHR